MEILDKKSNRMSRANAGVCIFCEFATALFHYISFILYFC